MDRMPPTPENRALPTDPARANDYDSFAEAYTAENESSIWNTYYERPAMLALAGDVAGRRILDAAAARAGREPVPGRPGPPAAVPRRRVQRRRRVPGAALPGGLGRAAGRAAAHADSRWTADPVREPSLRHPRNPATSRAPDQLFHDLQLDRGMDHGRPDRPDELLGTATGPDDRCLHPGRLPDLHHQRAAPRAGRP